MIDRLDGYYWVKIRNDDPEPVPLFWSDGHWRNPLRGLVWSLEPQWVGERIEWPK